MKRFILSIALALACVGASAANLATQTISSDFTVSLAAATVSGDAYVNDGRTFLVVTNGGGAPITVTVAVQRTTIKVPGAGTVTFAAIPVTVAAGATKWISVPQGPYNNSSGRVVVTYSGVTSVTVGAVRVPQL
jgi:hypothetical protein